MSAVIRLKAKELQEVLGGISPLIPSGSTEVPIGLHLKDDELIIVCLQGCVYQSVLNVIESDATVADCTFLYHNMEVLLNHGSEVNLEITPVSVKIEGDDFSASFPLAYSTCDVQTLKDVSFQPIAGTQYLDGLRSLTNANLATLLKISSPIIVEGEIALQKFPNVWIQARTMGLPICAVLDIDHVKLILRFRPKEVSTDITGTLVFRNNKSILQLPCKVNNSKDKLVSLLEDMSTQVMLSLGNYADRLRIASKTESKAHCKVTLFEHGIQTTIAHNNTEIALSAGDKNGAVLGVFSLPLQMWLTFLKVLNSEEIQILIGGSKVCLRTTTTAIVAHVLN